MLNRSRLSTALIASTTVAILLGGCAGGGSPADNTEIPEGEIGAAETTSITVAIPFPDVTMYGMYWVAEALGYYEEEGLTVDVISADNVAAAVASGSAQVGVESAGTVIEAIRGGVGVEVLSSHYCRQNFDFAVQPSINSVEDLDGTSIVLAGTPGDPAEFQRAKVLKEAGWDVSTVDVEIVYPGPGSDSWTEYFVNERISLQPFYGDDRPTLEANDAKIIVESLKNWANDLHVVSSDFADKNPNTLIRFLRATMKSVDYIVEPGLGEQPTNAEEILSIVEDNDYNVDELRKDVGPGAFGGYLVCPNLYFDKEAWDVTIDTQELEPLEFDESQLDLLLKAQELMDMDNAGPETLTYP
ncbi:hypothetical protein A20C1_08899 [marine actinobacterium PHSC20C1]|nr:hypothetical protein A20C1_08899 [marine actinobacterium PHSC20C1]